MARAQDCTLLLLVVTAILAGSHPAWALKPSSRKLNSSPYPVGSGSSPAGSNTPVSGGSPVSPGSSPSTTPTSTPLTTPSPVTIPPVVSGPSGRYGGYGSRTGKGTSGFFGRNPSSIPKVFSLLSTLAKLFGPRILKLFKAGAKPPTLLGALKDLSPEPMPSLFREASASLINAYSVKGFPLSTEQVITQFNSALDSPQVAAQQALEFQHLNEGV